jgi:Flp pilus assembly protein TadG
MRSMRARPRTPEKNRRGAALLLFVVALIPLLAMGAIAIDYTMWQMGSTQLHTIADAAALAGARALQLNPTTAIAGNSQTYASALASANSALQSAGTANTVTVGYWNTTTKTFSSALPTGANYNAVRVTTTKTASSTIGRIARSGGASLSRTSVAWVANLNGGTCVKPWALPYPTLHSVVTGTAIQSDPPLLTPTQLASIATMSTTARTITLAQPNIQAVNNANPAWPNTTYYDGNWEGFNLGNNASNQTYQDMMDPAACGQYTTTAGATGTTVPAGGQNNFPNWTNASMATVCNFSSNSSADCRTSSGSIGVDNKVVWGTLVAGTPGAGGSNGVTFKMVGYFRLLCYWRQATDICTQQIAGRPSTYPAGTIVGMILPITFRSIGSGDQLGNTPSETQRLILVQ